MADEPRRSGRATKGQHTKIQDDPAEAPASATTSAPAKAKGKSKKSKARQEAEQEEEEEEEQIRCLCNTGEDDDDGGRAFTCCDNCNVWQHNDCMGLPLKFNPEQYYCEQCRPEDHPAIIEALERGESPIDIAARNREEAHSKKKGGRKSKGARVSEVKQEPTPVATTPEQNKRKHTSETPSTQPSKLRKSSTQATADVSTPAKGGRLQATESLKLVDKVTDIKNSGRQNIAQALKKRFAQAIKEISSEGEYRIPDGDTPDSLGEKQALVVEYAMHLNLCGPSADPTPAYKKQFQSIISNIGPNPSLVFHLIDGSLTADALSTMSASDMATDEQKKRDKDIIEENERLAMIKEDESSRRRIRRTHKGEEYIDEETVETGANASFAAPPPPKRNDSVDGQAASPGAEQPRPPRISTDRSTFGGQEPGVSPGMHRRTSSNFNLQNVWSSVQSPTGDAQPSYRPQAQATYPTRQQGNQNDADIDRLLGDDEGVDSAPYSPTDAGADANVVWRGKVDMPNQPQSIACFDARAYHVAGSNLESREKIVSIFPREIALGGRVDSAKADEYLNSLSAASRTDVTVLDLVTSANDAKGQSEFNKLFDYLLGRRRFGVVREPHNPPVRDVYIIPLEEGTASKPAFLQRLEQNIVEDERSRRMLLIVFVLRYQTPAPSAQATPTTVQVPTSAMSPTVPGGPGPAQPGVPMQGAAQPSAPALSPSAGAPNGQLPTHPMHPPNQQSFAQTPSQPHPLPENPYAPSAQPSYLVNQLPQSLYQAQPNQTQPLQPPIQPPAPETLTLARNILGPYYDCATAQQLLNHIGVNPDMFQQLRNVFENHPETRTDFVAFQQTLIKGTGGS